jgi:hypothetical protein
MPETILLYRVLFAAPDDVTDELSVAEELVDQWNVQHGQRRRTRLELTNWKTHSYPSVGTRPQALLNRQFADRSDIVVGVFFKRLGTPTGKARSGTVEEIHRAVRKKKRVMVYFSKRRGAGHNPNAKREEARIDSYKRRFGRNALYGTYASLDEFRSTLRNHLALVMSDMPEPKGNAEP